MSVKNRDNKNRWRNITVGFRVSPEENELINKAVALSGLPKQEYCYRRCLNQDVVVQGNPRVFKALKTELVAVLAELKRIEAGNRVDEELLNQNLLLSGKLTAHLNQIDQEVTEQVEVLMKQMAEKQGVNENLKRQDQMKWVRLMNNIKVSAEEIVLKERVYM